MQIGKDESTSSEFVSSGNRAATVDLFSANQPRCAPTERRDAFVRLVREAYHEAGSQ